MTGYQTPWADDDSIYFRLQTPSFEAFELTKVGAIYTVPEFTAGLHRLPKDAICVATSKNPQGRRVPLIEVDLCQMFFVDCAYASRFREAFDRTAGAYPNYSYFDSLRNTVGIDFGYATVTSDGSYFLDLDRLEFLPRGPEPSSGFSPAKIDEYFAKVARRMNTFVCEVCFEEELMVADGQTAKRQGWKLVPPIEPRTTWFFKEFQVVCPKCATAARAGSQ